MDDLKIIEDELAAGVDMSITIKPANESGATMRTVRWMAETPHGWIGAYDREAIGYLLERLHAAEDDAEHWRKVYRRAINEANGLTNYVEDRPELWPAERRIADIESQARAIAAHKEGA
jgi:hypothetical protein